MDAIIFDIDGTLANVNHRRHHLEGLSPSWGRFFDGMVDDPPYSDVCLLAELLGEHPRVNHSRVKLFLLSGRPESFRKQTEGWLRIHIPSYFEKAEALLMRVERDFRKDTVIKREMLEFIRGQGYNVRLVVDDRPSVIQMWKREGVTVLAHDSGDWGSDGGFLGGELHMLVGPSGAGKSRFVEDYFLTDRDFMYSAVISSDGLRFELTGDLTDQTANKQVFAAMHALVRARIGSGLSTIVDATNLRARDRRKLRDCCGRGTPIHYYVIDRPLAEKHRDAGWRDNVFVKGEKLIDRHHRSFQSGIAAILAGDEDPRVTVHDHRRS